MAKYPFRILIESNDDANTGGGYFNTYHWVATKGSHAEGDLDTAAGGTFLPSSDDDFYFIDTAQDGPILNTGEVYERIRAMKKVNNLGNLKGGQHYKNTWTGSGAGQGMSLTVDASQDQRFGDVGSHKQLLSCSMHKSQDTDPTADLTGSIRFTAVDQLSETGTLKRYKFYGEKVCTILGVPCDMWLYPDTLRASATGSESTFIQGNVTTAALNVTDKLTISNIGTLNSDLPIHIDGRGGIYDRWIKFVNINSEEAEDPTNNGGAWTTDTLFGWNAASQSYELKGGHTTGQGETDYPFYVTASAMKLTLSGHDSSVAGDITFNGNSYFAGPLQMNTANINMNNNDLLDVSDMHIRNAIYNKLSNGTADTDTRIQFGQTNSITFYAGGLAMVNFSSAAGAYFSQAVSIAAALSTTGNVALGNSSADGITINGTATFNGGSTIFNKTTTPIYITSDGNDQFVFRKDGNTVPHTFIDQGNNDGAGTYYGFRFYNYNGGTTGTTVEIEPNGELITPRNPSFAIKKSADESVGATWETVTFNTEQYDLNSNYDGTNKFTAPVAGRYLFLCTLRWNPGASSHYIWSRLLKNGSAVRYGEILDANEVGTGDGGLDDVSTVMNEILDLNANDYVQVQVYSANDTSTLVGHAGSGEGTSFSGHLLG